MAKDCIPDFRQYRREFPEYEDKIDCIEEYLTMYDLYTMQPKNTSLVSMLYTRTLEMLKTAKETRRLQADLAVVQAKQAAEYLSNKYPDIFEFTGSDLKIGPTGFFSIPKRDRDIAQITKLALNYMETVYRNQLKVIEDIEDFCTEPAIDRVSCIEHFVSSAHQRGPVLPLGCGLPFPEYKGLIPEEKELAINRLSGKIADDVLDTLDCIARRF